MKISGHSTPKVLSVSRKAYAEFVGRICQVFASDTPGKEVMLNALDRYLSGERSVVETLDGTMRMIFEFLRYDVDKAIERSRRARERARNRRQPSSGRMDKATFESLVNEHLNRILTIVENDDADATDDKNRFHRPLTRRERRARERLARGKSRIKPLHQCG